MPQPDKLSLYLQHRAALVDYATPIVGCRNRAEDVVQEAWLRYSGLGPEVTLRQPAAYLYRIVRNLALDLTRRLQYEPRPGEDLAALDALGSDAHCPARSAAGQDALRQLAAALDELPLRTRTAFEMHRLGGYTLQQIAIHLGISVGLAHRLVQEALQHCLVRLGDGG